jgi:hypothetical protein
MSAFAFAFVGENAEAVVLEIAIAAVSFYSEELRTRERTGEAGVGVG